MAKNIESKLGRVPNHVVKRFVADYGRCLKIENPVVAEMMVQSLERNYTGYGLFHAEIKKRLLEEMKKNQEAREGDRK